MGALSFANAFTLLKAGVNVLQKTELFGASASPNYDGLFDTLIAANLGDYQDLVLASARAHRNAAASLLGPGAVRAILEPILTEMMAAINAPERSGYDVMWFRLYEYMVANSKTINSRGISYGSVSAGGGNIGTGTIRRLTVDEGDFRLEGGHNETKTIECVADQNQVDLHQEVFQVRGAKPEPDVLKLVGSGIVAGLRALSTQDSTAFIGNPSFSQFDGTQPTAGSEQTASATTSFTNWTLTTAANAKASVDTVYRDLVGEARPYSMKFTDNNKAVQAIATTVRARLSETAPIYVQVAVYRGSSCDGNFVLRWGAKTVTTAMSGLSNNAWNVITITLDKYCYYKQYKENALTIELELASRTTGHIYVDDVIVGYWTPIDGLYYVAVGGATPFLIDDVFTFADSEATRGIISYWGNHRSGRVYYNGCWVNLPSDNAAGETEADPS